MLGSAGARFFLAWYASLVEPRRRVGLEQGRERAKRRSSRLSPVLALRVPPGARSADYRCADSSQRNRLTRHEEYQLTASSVELRAPTPVRNRWTE